MIPTPPPLTLMLQCRVYVFTCKSTVLLIGCADDRRWFWREFRKLMNSIPKQPRRSVRVEMEGARYSISLIRN